MGNRSKPIDWSKAGTRLRRTPETNTGGRNPDWNWTHDRWKTAEEYAGEEMTPAEVIERVACPLTDCMAMKGAPCLDAADRVMDHPHAKRIAAAGLCRIAAGEFTL